jgi:type IV secretion system protein VirB10
MVASDTVPEADIRPIVGRAVSNRALWIFGFVMILAAIGLFSLLEARRTVVSGIATEPLRDANSKVISSPPELTMPGDGAGEAFAFQPGTLPSAPKAPFSIPQTLPGVPNTPNMGRYAPIPSAPIVRIPSYADAGSPDPVLPQRTATPIVPPVEFDDRSATPRPSGTGAGVTRIVNPSTTVPQGALIQAVLETALDSNRPGFVRAVVSRDVRSFDGTKILVPRGSRLFGEYKADLVDGQNRAFVLWQKLTRPDGSQIALESPAADPLGRAGIKGSVNTHFFERFAGSILQSALDIGVGVATRSASNGNVVIGLPGSNQTMINPSQTTIKPTLKVRHGSSVSVFVARDLDFITAG